MKAIGVIPARWASTRFPGKVLADIHGKPMIQYVWQQAKKAKLLNDVIVACDDDRVFRAVESFGGKAVMTSMDHPSGTDRIAEAVGDLKVEVVVNIQGDEPLISPDVIDLLVEAVLKDEDAPMATVVKRILQPALLENPNVVKVVFNRKQEALYFSRFAIPFNREGKNFSETVFYQHLGLYAYRRDFLMKFDQLPKSLLEETEKLEQLRVLEAGYRIRIVETDYESIGVDTPEDLTKVIQMIPGEING